MSAAADAAPRRADFSRLVGDAARSKHKVFLSTLQLLPAVTKPGNDCRFVHSLTQSVSQSVSQSVHLPIHAFDVI